MCFSFKRQVVDKRQNFQINLQDTRTIKVVKDFKYLGLVLDPQLKFDNHLKKISKTIQSNLN